ncbi:serine/threonine-protein kinase [Actinoplanes aureus]|uniref:serine/threonine-protein kinase n=1 Tax=Actinoplanes aureus TaxID=2792083 RepID=UPI001E36B3E0|nr:serine/threonine-protein kinase [Actinoplanes aureus]
MPDAPALLAGRYRLGALLGRGGMGEVRLARDEVLERDIAVKEIDQPPAEDGDAAARRTLREARAAARLNHPAVVQVYDVLQLDGRTWIVMEYVPSRSLRQVIQEDGVLDPYRAARIGLDLLAALRAAHRVGVQHRDVKPANVLLADDGRVLLSDFGIAAVDDDAVISRADVVVGSPQFMAPERAQLGAGGPEADLWSLGATLYAAVEGRAPFQRASTMATLAALATEEPDPPRQAGALKPLLDGLLRKDPAKRMGAEDAEALLRSIIAELAEDGAPAAWRIPRQRTAAEPPTSAPAARNEQDSLEGGGERDWPAAADDAEAGVSDGGAADGEPREGGALEKRAAAGGAAAGNAAASSAATGGAATDGAAAGGAAAGGAAAGSAVADVTAGSAGTDGAATRDEAASGTAASGAAADGAAADGAAAGGAASGAAAGRAAAGAAVAHDVAAGRATASDAAAGSSAPRDVAGGRAVGRGAATGRVAAGSWEGEPAADGAGRDGDGSRGKAGTWLLPVPEKDASPRMTRRAALAGVGALTALVAAGAVWLVAARGPDEPSAQRTRPDVTGSAGPQNVAPPGTNPPGSNPPGSNPPGTTLPESQPEGTKSPGTAPTAAPSGGAAGARPDLPAGWRDYRDATGFEVYVPAGWKRSKEGSIVYFRGDGRVLGIDQTDKPKSDPVADWENQSRYRVSRGDFPSYREIRIDPVRYFRKAADWEFTFNRGGVRQHVNNRGVVVADDKAYGFYWQTRDSEWDAAREDLQLVFDSFRPAR